MYKSSRVQRRELTDSPEPWRSWPLTARYLLVQVAGVLPNLVLIWVTVVHHLRE
jgi:hypothetical protein